MHAFSRLTSLVIPLDRVNVDTDAILPKQYLKSIARTGFGVYLFDDMRYLTPGDLDTDVGGRRLNLDCTLNQPRYQGGEILLARGNFGCGSSREHAVWALEDFGIRAIVAPSYADIFYGNCFKRGLLPVVLPEAVVDALFDAVAGQPGYTLSIDLAAQSVQAPDGQAWRFEVGALHKHNLLHGLDDIAVTLTHEPAIAAYEAARRALEPWLFRPAGG